MNKLLFGLKVKTLREHNKWSQAKLAEMVDISNNALSNIETGKYFPRLDNLIGISKALDMSVSFFLSDNEAIKDLCLEEIRKYLLIFDKRIATHIIEYIGMCSELCDKVAESKDSKNYYSVGIKINCN